MICSNCGAEVTPGKFCEKCGALLQAGGANSVQNNLMNVCPNCGAEISGGKFCERCGAPLNFSNNSFETQNSIFDKLKKQANKAATDLLAIKSDFTNGNIIFNVQKIPNVQEKKLKVVL